MQNGHPTEQELSTFVQFHLTADQAHEVGQHLRVCAQCNARYRETYKGKAGIPAVPEIMEGVAS